MGGESCTVLRPGLMRRLAMCHKDKNFITAEFKTLDRRKKNEWKRKGRSEIFVQLRNEFKLKYKKTASDY